jgi:putative flippase GtrA
MATMRREFLRFLVAGAVNTVLTYALYLMLLQPLGYAVAYAIAYALGIVLSYVLNARFVFHAPLRLHDFLRFPLVYVAQYALGATALWVLVERAGVREEWALAIVIALTVPLVFGLSRYLLAKR